jgi:threonine dehydratase
MSESHVVKFPSIEEIRQTYEQIRPHILVTPVVPWVGKVADSLVGEDTKLFAKLELMQFAGSFKVRAVLSVMMKMTEEEKARGVVAISAGNHAIAVSYAADILKINAVVVMPKNVSWIRIEKCKSRGAKVVLAESLQDAFLVCKDIQDKENRFLVHPFEGPNTALGNATLGLEFVKQMQEEELDAVIVGVGGGGFAAGVSCAVKQLLPNCKVYGVEPEGANAVSLSFKTGSPQKLDKVDTIADSLSPPYALPYSFSLCKNFLEEIVTVSDQELCEAMAFLYYELKLAVEPAAAAACAAAFGPLKEKIKGKKVGVVLCGSSIDSDKFATFVKKGESRYLSVLRGVVC